MTRSDADGPHVHVSFKFMHDDSGGEDLSQHSLDIEGVPLAGQTIAFWSDPTKTRVANSRASGPWKMKSKGRNSKNGCKGEDNGADDTPGESRDGGDDVIYTITVAPR